MSLCLSLSLKFHLTLNTSHIYTRRLWHQLTVALLEFVSDPANAEAGGGLVRLCTEFIAKFEAKMNQLRFVQILCAVGKTCSGRCEVANDAMRRPVFGVDRGFVGEDESH